ncbi:hypothetical protein HPB49_008622 [Dermacentor silvarum]|uniref:Uncharacterized protein n=1 Tax=Dermacentor silvarum TaxID=543639 RepID=A0ACB8DY42_DERSI|nr:hypothetical protein HPB49_008622 [Dermacentor silvarum]
MHSGPTSTSELALTMSGKILCSTVAKLVVMLCINPSQVSLGGGCGVASSAESFLAALPSSPKVEASVPSPNGGTFSSASVTLTQQLATAKTTQTTKTPAVALLTVTPARRRRGRWGCGDRRFMPAQPLGERADLREERSRLEDARRGVSFNFRGGPPASGDRVAVGGEGGRKPVYEEGFFRARSTAAAKTGITEDARALPFCRADARRCRRPLPTCSQWRDACRSAKSGHRAARAIIVGHLDAASAAAYILWPRQATALIVSGRNGVQRK